MRKLAVAQILLALAGCSRSNDDKAILYRNSPLDPTMRVYVALFEEPSGNRVNLGNCQMIARVLNANLAALAKSDGRPGHIGLGYWCEVGGFAEKGTVPRTFETQFPAP